MRDRSSSDRARRCAAAFSGSAPFPASPKLSKRPKMRMTLKHATQIRRGGSRQVQRCSTTMAAHVAAACSTAAVLVAASAGSSGRPERGVTRALVSRFPGRFFLRSAVGAVGDARRARALGYFPGSAGEGTSLAVVASSSAGSTRVSPGMGKKALLSCAACAASFKKKASTAGVGEKIDPARAKAAEEKLLQARAAKMAREINSQSSRTRKTVVCGVS